MTSQAMPETLEDVHRTAVVYDAICPLATTEQTLGDWIKGGVTVVGASLATNSCSDAMRSIGMWYRRLARQADKLLHVTQVENIERAKRTGKLGIIFHFQGSLPLEKDVGLVAVYYRLGVRVIQLTYNVKDFVGDGCEETGDGGLSDFGRELIKEMNRIGILVDLSHTGYHTTMEAMEVSEAPVVFSHSNAMGVHRSNRNLRDDQIKAVAAKNGVIGVTAFPGFVSDRRPQPTMDELLAHFDYIADLVGTDHIGFGCDYYQGQSPYATLERAQEYYQANISSGRWTTETYYPPPYIYPEGIETPDKLHNLTRALLEHGYSEEDVRKILGGNFMRVFEQVWK